MKLNINERSIPRRGRSDSDYIKTILGYQKDTLSWMQNFITSALDSIDSAERQIDSGDFGYDDFGRSQDDDEFFAPERKSVDDALSDLYDYDKTQEMYQLVYDYCDNIEKSIDVLNNVVINTD